MTTMKNKMPRVGQNVYIIYNDAIYREKVFMKNKTAFCFESIACGGLMDSYRVFYEDIDYGTLWFVSLKSAKEHIIKKYGKVTFKEIQKGYWEVFM